MNPYQKCPKYETKSFKLRLVNKNDAEALLKCYSDKEAVSKINADNCTSNFYYTSLEQMQECIDSWLCQYEKQDYVRFSIIPKLTNKAVGTVEIFGGEIGVLRIDISSEYEKEIYIEEIVQLAVLSFISDFEIDSLKIKVSNTPERVELLRRYGFEPSLTFRQELGYYERSKKKYFSKEKGIAYCGLACCVCSENENCVGCRNEGCKDKEWCKSFNCCKEKEINGCWECDEFPCDNPMLNKLRIRTFAEFILENGEEKLINELQKNEAKGVLYHYKNQLIGDYDLAKNKDEIKNLILK